MLDIPTRLDREDRIADVEWLRTFAALARHLNQCEDISEFFRRVAYSAARVTGCHSALVLWSGESGTVSGTYNLPDDYLDHGFDAAELEHVWTPIVEAWNFGVPVMVEDIEAESRLGFWLPSARRGGVRGMATFPLTARGEVLGVLNLYFAEPHSFGPVETDAAAAVADFAAAAIHASLLQTERARELEKLERHLAERLRLEQFHQALTEASLARAGIDSLVSVAANASGLAIAVHDAAGRVLAEAAPADAAYLVEYLRPEAHRPPPADMVVLTRPLAMQATRLGTLVLLTGEADESGQQVISYLGMAVEREMAVLAQNRQARERVLEDLLEQLLHAETARDVEAVRRLFASHDFALEFPIQIAVASMDDVDSDSEVVSGVASSLRGGLGQQGAFVSRLGRRLVALRPGALDDSLGGAVALALQGQRGTWTTVKFDHVGDLSDLQGAIGVAGKLLDLAARRPDSARLIDGGHVGIAHVLLEASETVNLARFLAGILGPLRDYDERHGSELVKTLRTFSANEFRSRDTAAALFIHTNTLGYRVSKISQLIDRDLRLASALAEVHLACLLDEVLSPSGVNGVPTRAEQSNRPA